MKFWTPALVSLALFLIAPAVPAADQADFEEAYEAAVTAQEKAASVSGEWRDIGKFLKEAKKLAAAGDFEAATKLAEKAENQGHRGYEQMTSQAGKVGPEPFLQSIPPCTGADANFCR